VNDVELGLRMIAAFPGPGRLTCAATFGGRRYVGVGEETAGLGPDRVRAEETGCSAEDLGGDHYWTDDPDPLIGYDVSTSEAGRMRIERRFMHMRAWAGGLKLVSDTGQGYVGKAVVAGEEGFADGHYLVENLDLETLHVWIGAAPPAWAGNCVLDVTEGTLEPVEFDGASTLSGMCVSDGRLWVCGEDDDGDPVLQGWDGATWVNVPDAPRLTWLWDVDGALYGAGDDGCYVLTNWQELRVGEPGTFGVAVDGKARWMQYGAIMGWRVLGGLVQIAVRNGARFGLVGRGGRAHVLQDAAELGGGLYGEPHQELAWIDGASARGIVKWRKSGANLDNLATWANRLWGFGVNSDGAPVALRLGSGTARIAECGPWRIDQAAEQAGGMLLAVGRQPDRIVGPPGVGQVVLETCGEVMLHELRHEAADGTGETPVLRELSHEAVIVPTPPVMLEEIVHEASDGTGETPVLRELTHEGSDGTGDSPEVWEIIHEAIVVDDGSLSGATLEDLRHEAATGVPGPVEGEHAWLLECQARGNVDMVRILTQEPLGEDWRAIMRLDRQALSVTAWDTFEKVPLGENYSPAQVGSYIEVWIIGAVGRTAPIPVTVAYRTA
jgi:hypothetical protein